MLNPIKPLEWEDGRPPRWIPVEVGLPELGAIVLVTTVGGYITIGYVEDNGYWSTTKNPDKYELTEHDFVIRTIEQDTFGEDEDDIPYAWAYMPIPYI